MALVTNAIYIIEYHKKILVYIMPFWIHLRPNDSSFPHTLPTRMYSERLNCYAVIFNDIDLELNINDQIYFSSTISSTKS